MTHTWPGDRPMRCPTCGVRLILWCEDECRHCRLDAELRQLTEEESK